MARILIGDDALFTRTILTRMLTANGHEVVGQAEDGDEVVAMTAALDPDLIILDISMPVMDGLTALDAVMAANPARRVIMCSGLGQEEKVRRALDAGARDFIVKPIVEAKLLTMIERAMHADAPAGA